MVIESLKISDGYNEKEVVFGDEFNLIHSDDNSKGKTTLLRLLLHSLGYPIPKTAGFTDFNKISTILKIKVNKIHYNIIRNNNIVKLNYNNITEDYVLPNNLNLLHSIIYGIKDVLVLDNLLATFYIDQEKGWTMLNRGKIIGNIRFNIEDFMAGLDNKDLTSITVDLKSVEQELSKYKYLEETAKYKQQLDDNMDTITITEETQELIKQQISLQYQIKDLKKELDSINLIIVDNNKFIKYIEKMELSILDCDNKEILVTKKNILNFSDNQQYHENKKSNVIIEIAKIERKLKEVESILQKRNSLFEVQTITEEMDVVIKNMNIDEYQIQKAISSLTKEKRKLREQLNQLLINNNFYIESFYKDIKKYAVLLGIEDKIDDNPKFVLTSNLKRYSGRILNEMSFIFKLAYINQIKKKYNLKLPIIIDSLKQGELSDKSAMDILNVLKKEFGDHQIIISSIYNFNNIPKNIIEIKDHLMEQ